MVWKRRTKVAARIPSPLLIKMHRTALPRRVSKLDKLLHSMLIPCLPANRAIGTAREFLESLPSLVVLIWTSILRCRRKTAHEWSILREPTTSTRIRIVNALSKNRAFTARSALRTVVQFHISIVIFLLKWKLRLDSRKKNLGCLFDHEEFFQRNSSVCLILYDCLNC